MFSMRLPAVAALAVIMTLGSTNIAAAQAADAPQEPEVTPEAPQAETPMPDQEPQAGQQQAMPRDMMRPGRMGYHGRMMGGRGHMMKMMFAIADADGNDALSFEEISTIHRRVFDAIDADGNGEVTQEEIETFVRE
ncbi:EF-hand domain-containing protein [Sinorhizobium sojae]|uniref:EF-hand domain-containing protein n=1 Tax=Sinorhizobium sojae TaxID=716925 RepID=UPI00055973A4|nr:EF-hand domain-containing protein [Sinorhizobium sojae]